MKNILKWVNTDINVYSCFAFNFGYEEELFIPQLALDFDDERCKSVKDLISNQKFPIYSLFRKWNIASHGMNVPNGCSIVIIAGKYLTMVDKVMEKIDKITEDIAHMPEVVFVMLTKEIPDVEVDILARNNMSPPMVSVPSSILVLGLNCD